MRLSPTHCDIIKIEAKKIFGEETKVFLFGSRVDDTKKGGDIDLMLELAHNITEMVIKIILLNGKLQQQLGPQKIDIIVHTPNAPLLPIHQIAKKTGILL